MSQTTTISFSSGGTHRTWTCTASAKDTAKGQLVTVSVSETTSGLTPPASAETWTLTFRHSNGGSTIRGPINVSDGSTVEFYLTSDGLQGSSARFGSVEMEMRVARTTTPTYDHNSRTGGSVQTGFTATRTRGWFRGTTTATLNHSGDGYTGPPWPWYPYGWAMYVRLLADAQSYETTNSQRPMTARVGSVITNTAYTGAVSGSSMRFDFNFDPFADNRFPAAATDHALTVTPGNSPWTGEPWTVMTTTPSSFDVTVDPRLTVEHHLQLNSADTFDESVTERLTSDLGFATVRVTDSVGFAVNDVIMTETLRDANQLVAAVSRSGGNNLKTAHVAGATPVEDGWLVNTTPGAASPYFLTWDSQLPAGTWVHRAVITGPSNAVGLESPQETEWTLNVFKSTRGILVAGGPATVGESSKHWSPGMDLLVGVALFDSEVLNVLDPIGPVAYLGRFRADLGVVEYFDEDTANWVTLTDAAAPTGVTLAPSPADSRIYVATISDTATWGHHDVIVVGTASYDGTPYWGFSVLSVTGSANSHDRYRFDGAGFLGFPSR